MFKDRLRNLRKENNLTQEELAKKIFVSRSTICKWEIGNGIPSDANLESLCNLFNVSKEWLLDLEDYKVYVNKKIKTYKLSQVITLLVFAFISGIASIILLAGLSYLNTYNDIGALSLWVFPILASFVIPVILVLIARKMNYSQNVLISTKIFVLIIISIAVTLGSFALEINNIMNNSSNTPDRICWEMTNQQIFFTKDKDCIVRNIHKFIEQNKEYYKNGEDNISYDEDIIVVLDGIQDPGNLGTILRTLDSVNLKQIILSEKTADPYNPKVVRSTMGAIYRVNMIRSKNIIETIKNMKKHKYDVVATSLQTDETIYDIDYKKKVIIIGNEANGVSNEVLELANKKAKIPMLRKNRKFKCSSCNRNNFV